MRRKDCWIFEDYVFARFRLGSRADLLLGFSLQHRLDVGKSDGHHFDDRCRIYHLYSS